MATNGPDEFVTIVPVGQPEGMAQRATADAATFITVLSMGAESGAAEVTINRPRGSRLGLGLKFEGGSGVTEHVQRLLVQSCSEKSPADRALSPWGKLIPGDEIVAIDGVFVSELTRIECVRRLKDSDEILKILVRHTETIEINTETKDQINVSPTKDKIRSPPLPPPVPPRKINRKSIPVVISNSEEVKDLPNKLDMTTEQLLVNSHCIIDKMSLNRNTKLLRKSSLDSHTLRKCIESAGVVHKRRSPEEVRRLVRRLSDSRAIPPTADTYIDLLSQECERRFVIGDCESDDTGSSISTVVDRMSLMMSSVENSKLSTPIIQQNIIEMTDVLKSIENMESEKISQIQASSIKERDENIKSVTEIKCKPRENNEVVKFKDEVNIQNCERRNNVPEYYVRKIKKNDSGNDNNNNTTGNITCINIEFDELPTDVPGIIKPKIRPKPQPLPRNIKKNVPENEVKTMSTEINSKLLCPTKKVCIENWLQTSVECETKLTDAKPEYQEENSETLPRLIHFVTKPQYKSTEKLKTDIEEHSLSQSQYSSKNASLSREEGASLNTIGEDDESSETLHANPKVALKNYYEATNIPDESISPDGTVWRDTCIKVDQHKMINFSGMPPIFPRQPPDGDEAPCEVDEACLVTPAALLAMPAMPTSNALLLPEYTRRSIYSRLQDARSECSVKEKIALFSNKKAISTDHVNKIGIPTITKTLAHHTYASERHPLDRRLTKSSENLDELPNNSYRHSNIGKRPEVVGGIDRAIPYDEIDSKIVMKGSHLVFPHQAKHYHTNLNEETVINVVDKFSNSSKDTQSSPKSTLDYFIKQRKDAMSKLRNLMIPEIKAEADKIIDLPEIKVQSAYIDTYVNKLNPSFPNDIVNVNQNKYNKESRKSNPSASWKTNSLPNNIPKYSPAFKRKSLQVFNNDGITIGQHHLENNEKRAPSKPPRTSIFQNRVGKTMESKINLSLANKTSKYNNLVKVNVKKNEVTKKYLPGEFADSDNDSTVSSTQSSCRSSPLPASLNIESDSSQRNSECMLCLVNFKFKEIQKQSTELSGEKPIATRSMSTDTSVSLSSSTGSAATSGSQASCSSMESSQDICLNERKNKVVRTHSIDTIHRRHILDSAKCRSGRDFKPTPPSIVAKCSHTNENAQTQTKRFDRLSTLNLNVSANSNKGEKRRSWAKQIDSDTDSDNDLLCQRKNDFKSLRPRKNMSAASKTEIVRKEINPEPEFAYLITERTKPLQNYKKGTIQYTGNTCPPAANIATENQAVYRPTQTSVYITKKAVNKDTSEVDVFDLPDPNQSTNKVKIVQSVANFPNVPNVNATQVKKCIRTVRLQRGSGAGVGIVLAGGVDCEAKTVTIHKVLSGSPADKDGRLCKGNRVVSINGHDMSSATHAHSVFVLKELRPEVILVVEEADSETPISSDIPPATECKVSKQHDNDKRVEELISVALVKGGAGAGLGLGLAGGRDSPDGDRPITVKKLFTGGAAARSGHIAVGATLEMVNGQRFDGMTRTQAWNMLKALSPGPVTLVLRPPNFRPCDPEQRA